jgi:hypothetical protein
MPRVTESIVVVLSLISASIAAADAQPSEARLRVTQRALVVQCFNGAPVAARTRAWTVTAPVTLAVTMRNQPRPGMAHAGDADAGTAIVQFTPEPGHRYEVEVRADAAAFSARVWPKGGWVPVVRDRTADRVVSGEPEWATPPCAPGR